MESSFLARLPTELRDQIYELVLCRPQPRSILLSSSASKLPAKGAASTPPSLAKTCRQRKSGVAELPVRRVASTPLALAQTCRQIRTESLPIFFGGKQFNFHTDRISTYDPPYGVGARWLTRLEEWLDAIGGANRRRLRTVDIDIGFWTVHPLESRDGQFADVVWSCLVPVLGMLDPSTEVWLACRLLWNDGFWLDGIDLRLSLRDAAAAERAIAPRVEHFKIHGGQSMRGDPEDNECSRLVSLMRQYQDPSRQ